MFIFMPGLHFAIHKNKKKYWKNKKKLIPKIKKKKKFQSSEKAQMAFFPAVLSHL